MEIKARIPGTIVAINVKPGDTVKAAITWALWRP